MATDNLILIYVKIGKCNRTLYSKKRDIHLQICTDWASKFSCKIAEVFSDYGVVLNAPLKNRPGFQHLLKSIILKMWLWEV
jgi:hypothetical protein